MQGFCGAFVFAESSSEFSVLDTYYRWATHITLLTPVVRGAQGKLEPVAENAFGHNIKVERFDSSPPPEK